LPSRRRSSHRAQPPARRQPARYHARRGAATRANRPTTQPLPSSTELETTGRDRADETRATYENVPARRRRGDVTHWEPVDEEELGVNRRQFMNQGPRRAGRLLARRLRRRLPRVPLAYRSQRLWRQDLGRPDRRHQTRSSTPTRRRSTCPQRGRTSCSTRSRTSPPPRRCTARSRTPAWWRATSRSTSAASTSAAASRGASRRSGSNAVPRLEVQPGRREEGGPGPARARPLRDDRGRRHADDRHRRHRDRAADRHQHDRSATGRPALRLISMHRNIGAMDAAWSES